MIEFLSGKLVEKHPDHVVLDINGVGYMVLISLNTYEALGNDEFCKLFIHFSVSVDVRSGSSNYQLFGFKELTEREVFRALIGVSGVSSNISRTILSSLSLQELTNAIEEGQDYLFKKVKGVGPKLASKIIQELNGKIGSAEMSEKISLGQGNTKSNEALSALQALGFDKNSARKALSKVMQNSGSDLSVEELIKESLKLF